MAASQRSNIRRVGGTVELAIARCAHVNTRNERINFKHHRYQVGMLMDDTRRTCVMSCTQSGKTELNLIRVMAAAMAGRSVFYVLPTLAIRQRVVSRFNRTIAAVPLYRAMHDAATEVVMMARQADSVSLKQFANATICFVGSNSEASFGEFPADMVIIDELDRCVQKNLGLADQRLAASMWAGRYEVSNPTLASFGIAERFDRSTGNEWRVKCGACGKRQRLQWDKNVVTKRDGVWALRWKGRLTMADTVSGVVCRKCRKPIDRYQDGEWVPRRPSKERAGYHISQLFAGHVSIAEMFENFIDAIGDQTKTRQFYNGRLGEPFQDAEAELTRADLLAIVQKRPPIAQYADPCFGGLDIGGTQHLHIMDADANVLMAANLRGNMDHFLKRLAEIFQKFPRLFLVIDAGPETMLVKSIAATYRGRVAVCYFHDTPELRLKTYTYDHIEHVVKAGRTEAFDESHAALTNGIVSLPTGLLSMPGYLDQMTAPVRVYQEPPPTKTEGRYIWTAGNKADHYRLSFLYAWLARMIRARYGRQAVSTLTLAEMKKQDAARAKAAKESAC